MKLFKRPANEEVKAASVKRQAAIGGSRQATKRQMSVDDAVDSISILPWLSLLGLLVLAMAVLIYVPNPMANFPIHTVKVKSDLSAAKQAAVESVLANEVAGKNYFDVDLRAAQSLLENMHWVDVATVERRWPGILVVALEEKVPVARWNADQAVSHHGELFDLQEVKNVEHLPLLEGGAEDAEKVMNHYYRVAKVLKPTGLRIKRLVLQEHVLWRLTLDNGISVSFGDKQSLEHLNKFVFLYQQKLKEQRDEILHVDLRYTDGVAVEWKPAITDEPKTS